MNRRADRHLARLVPAGPVLVGAVLAMAGCTVVGGPAAEGGIDLASARARPGIVIGKNNDTRVRSDDPRIGRTINWNYSAILSPCTAWMASNGVMVTAGHCALGDAPENEGTCADRKLQPTFGEVEFNVPLSKSNGYPVPAPDPADHYEIDLKHVQCEFRTFPPNAVRTDWALFHLLRSPIPRQSRKSSAVPEAFFRPSDLTISEVAPKVASPVLRVTGYGLDGPPPCYGDPDPVPGCDLIKPAPPRNEYSSTQQTAIGPFLKEIASESTNPGPYDVLTDRVDTTSGNSGSPVVLNGTSLVFGIFVAGINATDNKTNVDYRFNIDQSLRLAKLKTALHSFPGTLYDPAIPSDRIFYVDREASVQSQAPTGNLFEPYTRLSEAFARTSDYSAPMIVSVVAGIYGGKKDPDEKEPHLQDITVTPKSTVYLDMPVGDVVLWGTEN